MNILDTFGIKQMNKNKTFKSLKCHPQKNKTVKTTSCFDNSTILLLKKIWNKRYPDNKIKSRKPTLIWKKIKDEMVGKQCDNEKCWIQQIVPNEIDKKKIESKTFAPNAPNSWNRNINEWLDSNNIRSVMRQYEEARDNFKFLGPSPIDFNEKVSNYCVWPEICNINIKSLYKKGKTQLGFIFNTDKHYQPGSHWIAMYVDLIKGVTFYFDSNGNPIPSEIEILMNEIKKQCSKLKIKMRLDSNVGFKHQNTNTECGMYCLYFIISLLEKKHNFVYFKKTKINDKKVENLRKVYFNL